MSTISTDNYTIGSGNLYFCATVADDKLKFDTVTASLLTSSYNLGNVIDTELNVDVTYIDHWISVKGKRVKDKTIANTTSVMLNFSFDEMNSDNMKKFFMASDGATSEMWVVQDVAAEGSALLRVDTDIGQDLTYYIPKCTLKPDGALSLNDEDWHSAPMVLEVLQYISGDTANATINASWLVAPFGIISTATVA
jgi:hypothetical protein